MGNAKDVKPIRDRRQLQPDRAAELLSSQLACLQGRARWCWVSAASKS